MRLESVAKFHSPKSPMMSDSPRATASDSLSGTDVMAAMGMAQSQAGFGMAAFCGKHELSQNDKQKAINYLMQFAHKVWAVNHYRDNAITYKAQRDKNARELKLANAAITDMQMRQRDVAALDAKYTKELADAKAENDALRDDVAAGRRRLHIKAVCQSVREATTASGVDNAASPRLADTAERDYFTLRERLITMQKQLEGTQKYINEQCR
ncbi:hypothetical protein VEE42_14430 [Escherichia coli]|nr:hypothetical protein VEE42_14430 [Escherichia coli]